MDGSPSDHQSGPSTSAICTSNLAAITQESKVKTICEGKTQLFDMCRKRRTWRRKALSTLVWVL
ncbi:hypothetical protein GQ600_8224 [Phytophthora cactorum]|nr:hypothetical protein GQ600_8224 [Phytophthora cactorum]